MASLGTVDGCSKVGSSPAVIAPPPVTKEVLVTPSLVLT